MKTASLKVLKIISVIKPLVRCETKKEKPENLMIYWLFLAERVGFEPTVGCPTPDFESGPL